MDSNQFAYRVTPDLKEKGHELLNTEHAGIQSIVLHKFDGNKAHLFALHEQDVFPTHATPRHAMIQVVDGRAIVELGEDEIEAVSNTWIYMPPSLPHRIQAQTAFIFVLHVQPVN